MAGPLMPNPHPPQPPPIELNGRWNVGTLGKKSSKKRYFSLMARPLREELFLQLP